MYRTNDQTIDLDVIHEVLNLCLVLRFFSGEWFWNRQWCENSSVKPMQLELLLILKTYFNIFFCNKDHNVKDDICIGLCK